MTDLARLCYRRVGNSDPDRFGPLGVHPSDVETLLTTHTENAAHVYNALPAGARASATASEQSWTEGDIGPAFSSGGGYACRLSAGDSTTERGPLNQTERNVACAVWASGPGRHDYRSLRLDFGVADPPIVVTPTDENPPVRHYAAMNKRRFVQYRWRH